jgi:ribonucleoside-diphosphate reductase beta chain
MIVTAAKFKLTEDSPIKVDGMTVFNPNKVDLKKQPMFFGAPLGIQRYDTYK